MLIEFFGFPGSGKTTINNKLIQELRNEDIKVVRGAFDHLDGGKRVLSKAIFSFLCFFYSPNFFFYNFNFFLKNKSISDFLNITYLFARYSYFRNTDKVVIFDQGLTQAYLSIIVFVENGESYLYQNLLKKIGRVIVLELDERIIVERLDTREDKSSRVQNKKNTFKLYFDKFLIVKNMLNQKEDIKVSVLDAALAIEHNTKLIKNLILLK